MNLQLVLGSEAYGINTAGAAITAQKNVGTLKAGSHLVLLDGKTVYDGTPTTGTDLADFERVQFFVGLKNAKQSKVLNSVPIPRRAILKIDRQAYSEDKVKIVDVDFASVATEAEGSATISLFENSYNRTIKIDRINATTQKKAGQTAAQLVTAIASKINNRTGVTSSFVTATVNNTVLRLTMSNANVDFSMTLDDLLAGLKPVTHQEAYISLTNAEDILRTEKEYSGNLGNGNYLMGTDMYWSFPQQTDLSETYDVFNIKWQGEHDTPQNRQRSAVLWLKIAVPTENGDAFATLLSNLFGAAHDKALGAVVPEKDKKFETDGNPTT